MTPAELFAKELMTYDTGSDAHDAFYYSLPYHKDYDLCNWRPLRMCSGNVIKFYQYRIDKPIVLCTDPGDGVFTASPAPKETSIDTEAMPEEMMAEVYGSEEEQPLDAE